MCRSPMTWSMAPMPQRAPPLRFLLRITRPNDCRRPLWQQIRPDQTAAAPANNTTSTKLSSLKEKIAASKARLEAWEANHQPWPEIRGGRKDQLQPQCHA